MNEDASPFGGKLFTVFPPGQSYPSNDRLQSHLLEQYRLYVEMADRISNRRQAANSYFLTVNTALLSFVGYITTKDTSDYLWLLSVVGVSLCYLWYCLIRSYRNLNSAKFNVIHEIEKRLPISPYDAEWEAMERGKNSKLYKPVTHIETGVPWIFVTLHLFVFFRTFPWCAIQAWLS
jgi:hypothetical protein